MRKHIEINIWKACNNKCRFCMSSINSKENLSLVSFDKIKLEIIKYWNNWYNSIWFLWWDISIHPKIYEIITFAKEKWFKDINVITNGMIFSDYTKAEKLVLSWVTRVNISIHSHLEQIEDYLTQITGWLNKKIKAIDNFNKLHNEKKLRDALSINIVLNKLNCKDIFDTCVYFYNKKRIKDIRINFLWNRFFFSEEDKNKLQLRYKDFLPYLKKLIVFSLKTDIRLTFDTIPACIFAKLWFKNLDYILKRFMWESGDHIDEVSNINKNQIFSWKWQKDKLKTKFKKCVKCIYFNSCQWVWDEYYEKYWSKEFDVVLPYKNKYLHIFKILSYYFNRNNK